MQDESDAASFYSGPSKSQVKRDLLELQTLAMQMLELPAATLEKLDLGTPLMNAVREMRRLTNLPARRRQQQFLGKLLRDIDTAPLRRALEERDSSSRAEVQRLKQVEQWRDRLLADDKAWGEWVKAQPQANTQELRTLVRNARREQTASHGGHGPRYRELFKSLREALA